MSTSVALLQSLYIATALYHPWTAYAEASVSSSVPPSEPANCEWCASGWTSRCHRCWNGPTSEAASGSIAGPTRFGGDDTCLLPTPLGGSGGKACYQLDPRVPASHALVRLVGVRDLDDVIRDDDANGGNDARRAWLSATLSVLTANDGEAFEYVTGHSVLALSDALLNLDTHTFREVFSNAKFVDVVELNVKGLHVLRSLVAVRINEVRRKLVWAGGQGSIESAEYREQFERDGIIAVPFAEDTPSASWYTRILSSISDAPFEVHRLSSHQLVHAENDSQRNVHVDTFHPVIKVWLFENVTSEHGPLRYVRGSHKMSLSKLRWLFSVSNDRTCAEQSFRLSARHWHGPADLPHPAEITGMRMLVIADTSGFHGRGQAPAGTIRSHMSFGPNPIRIDAFAKVDLVYDLKSSAHGG